jgi:hypothetical protein
MEVRKVTAIVAHGSQLGGRELKKEKHILRLMSSGSTKVTEL